MQLIAKGPDIPIGALHAQEDGQLVFFCGAGVSIPCGLPSFEDLVGATRERLGAIFTPQEEREFKAKAFDRVLGLLEGRFGSKVRWIVVDLLKTTESANLDLHRALLTLGRRASGSRQLVTTNFDNLFETADPEFPVIDAPGLPIPKPGKWDALVHLHGRIVPSDPDARRLVLTAADFAVAYLVERWAARFVSELFQQYDVLFVGYSASDPVMRYLVDAIAVERQADRRLHKAYAFAECQQGREEEVTAEWRARGIDPILYDPVDGHAALRETLTTWARKFNGGLLAKNALVSELGAKEPVALPREEREQFCWAVGDASGAPARRLAEMGTQAQFEWVRVLQEFGVLPRQPNVHDVRRGLANRAAPYLPPDAVTLNLATWVAQHAGTVECLEWMGP